MEKLHYYTMPSENGKYNYEIDFLISGFDKISPIEVKASGYKRHISLDKFIEKYSARISEKYLVYTKNLKKEGEILYVPIYMAPFL